MEKYSRRNPLDGHFDVIGHGSPNDVEGLSASELASRLRADVSWNGQDVRLLSCSTGCPSGTFAQDLANQLGVRVVAPTTDVGASGSGKTLTIFDDGFWQTFSPV
jgi:hypothetical protein